ncbi:hypothetical protein NBRC116590_17340 [Pelagimonas sp. KU-00592-HH]
MAVVSDKRVTETKDSFLAFSGYGCLSYNSIGRSGLSSAVVPLNTETYGLKEGENVFLTEGQNACPGDQGAPTFVAEDGWGAKRLVGLSIGTKRKVDNPAQVVATMHVDLSSPGVLSWFDDLDSQSNGRITVCRGQETEECPSPSIIEKAALQKIDAQVVSALPDALTVVFAAGETIESVYQRVCGFPISPFSLPVQRKLLDLQGISVDSERRFVEDGTAEFVGCLTGGEIVHTVRRKDRLYDYFLAQCTAGYDFFTKSRNPLRDGSFENYVDAFLTLNPTIDNPNALPEGTAVFLPSPKGQVVCDEERLKELREINQTGEPIHIGDVSPGETVERRQSYFLHSGFDENDVNFRCRTKIPSVLTEYPYSISEMLESVSINRLNKKRESLLEARIHVADTGIWHHLGHSLSYENTFLMKQLPKDVTLSLNMASSADRPALHGTMVVSQALGGPLALQFFSAFERPQIHLDVARVFDLSRTFNSLEANEFLFDKALKRTGKADVVNFSFSTSEKRQLPKLSNTLEKSAFLLVVAAGNQSDPVENSFPASWGGSRGEYSKRVVTVASQDGLSDYLSPFSNYNRKVDAIDIAAPGCEVPVLSKVSGVLSVTRSTGSSFAAPLVSFIAALLHSEGIETPEGKKLRILSGSDLRLSLPKAEDYQGEQVNDLKTLAEYVVDGRTVNVAKTLLVHSDILEVNTDQSKGFDMLVGDATILVDEVPLDLESPLELQGCKSANSAFEREGSVLFEDIRKLTPFLRTNSDEMRILIYEEPREEAGDEGLINRMDCSLPGLVSVQMRTLTGEERLVPLDQVRDFVPRVRF